MKNLYAAFMLISVGFYAQTHRFIYDYQYKLSAEDTLTKKAYFHLDVNSDKSYFYERKYFIADSLQKANQPFGFEGKMTDLLSRDRKGGKVSTITFKGFDSFLMKDQPSQNWKIHQETKRLGNLKLQKATTTWSGRNWEAWFAAEIPLQEGPHKFSGLPGLIAELSDDGNNFSFKLIRSQLIKQTSVVDLWYNNQFIKPVEISYTQYEKMLLQHYKSPLQTLITREIDYKKSPLITEDGTKIDNEQKFRAYETAERYRIRKYNNPLELSLKISYPD